MLVFVDIFSDDEMFSDSFDMKEVNGAVYEVSGVMVTKGDDDLNNDQDVKTITLVEAFFLQKQDFDLRFFLLYIKGYMKAIKFKLVEQGDKEALATFEKGAEAWLKTSLIPHFREFDFYTGPSQDTDGMVAFLNYREDGVTPYLAFWKHGLKAMKI